VINNISSGYSEVHYFAFGLILHFFNDFNGFCMAGVSDVIVTKFEIMLQKASKRAKKRLVLKVQQKRPKSALKASPRSAPKACVPGATWAR
jgi:hypothetical protein